MRELLKEYIGTVPQWGMFLLLLTVAVRTSPQWLNVWSAIKIARSNRNAERIRELEQLLMRCHDECDSKITKLQDVIAGMREQDYAKQAAIMRAIVRMSNDPEVKVQLELLEAMQMTTAASFVKQVGNVEGDNAKVP